MDYTFPFPFISHLTIRSSGRSSRDGETGKKEMSVAVEPSMSLIDEVDGETDLSSPSPQWSLILANAPISTIMSLKER